MRIWLDPAKVAARGLTAGEVIAALQAANLQVAAGAINQPPATSPGAFQLSVQTLGRLSDPAQFGDIVVRADPDGYVRVRDIARVELGAQTIRSTPISTAMLLPRWSSSNGRARTRSRPPPRSRHHGAGEEGFSSGLDYSIVYNPTEFIQQSVNEVVRTLFEAIGLVVIVVIVFLQTWRAAIIPIVAIPVSLIGCFLMMSGLGLTFNTLSLFGLVLAIGIVVDDAIVVVENVERISVRACGRGRPRIRRWTRSAAHCSRSRWCCARCLFRPPSLPGCKAPFTSSSRSPSRPLR